jgi:hypothetical protein
MFRKIKNVFQAKKSGGGKFLSSLATSTRLKF